MCESHLYAMKISRFISISVKNAFLFIFVIFWPYLAIFYPKSDLKVTEMLANVNFYLFRPQTLGKNSKIFEKITSRNPAYV